MLLLDERILADGTHARTHAELDGGRVRIADDDGTSGELSIAALDRVMTRYGRELAPGVVPRGDAPDEDALALPGGYCLRRLRYHAAVDATGRDYLVWERPDGAPLAVVATMATSALRYLVLRISGEAQKTEC